MKSIQLKLSLLVFALLFTAPFSSAESLGPAFDRDVERFAKDFASPDKETLEEALVQLRWAGITDPRIYTPLIEKLRGDEKLPSATAKVYTEALSLSGNPAVRDELEQLSTDKAVSKTVRTYAKKYLKQFTRYQHIAEDMNVGLEQAQTNKELWALRHKNGLAVDESPRVRLAARDLYLHGYGKESLDVAAEVLLAHADAELKDKYIIDAMAFLCKALGLSGITEYKDVLIDVANHSNTPKLVRYAERGAQYFDSSFSADSSR